MFRDICRAISSDWITIFLLFSCNISWVCGQEVQNTIQGEDFVMKCYKPMDSYPSDFYVELYYQVKGDTEVQIVARYMPSSQVVKGAAVEDITNKFYGRIEFTSANSLTLKSAVVGDEGVFTCTGRSFDLATPIVEAKELVVYVKPVIEVTKMVDPLKAGMDYINAALCSAKNGKPKAEVIWTSERNLLLNYTNSESPGLPKTTTSSATLYVAPTKFYNGQPFMCTITHPALQEGRNSTIIILNVQYPASTPEIRVINDGTALTCSSDGNPEPTLVWTLPSLAPSPSVVGADVPIISPQDAERQNDTYTCTASNDAGPSSSTIITTGEASVLVTMVNQSNTGAIVGAVIGSLILVAVIALLIYWFFIRRTREKDTGPYNPNAASHDDSHSHWGSGPPSGRPQIEHANESLNKNRPPSPSHPPPHDEEEDNKGSVSSHSDIYEEKEEEGHDVEVPLTRGHEDGNRSSAIISRNSVNFQHRRQRPSTSPHRRSQKGVPEPAQRSMREQEPKYSDPDPHYEVPPMEYYDDEYNDDEPLHDQHLQDEPMDDRFYDLPENRYPQRYQQPPQRMESLPPYAQEPVQYASIDHSYKDPSHQRTRPPYQEPVEYAEIRSHGQIV